MPEKRGPGRGSTPICASSHRGFLRERVARARGASEGTPRLVGFRDENDAFVGRSSHQEVTHYCQENQNGDPVRNRASIVVPLAYHGVVGVDRTLIPAKMKDKFIRNTGRAWRLMRAACLAFPLNHFVVALRLLPRTFGGVDAGIIQDSSVTYDPSPPPPPPAASSSRPGRARPTETLFRRRRSFTISHTRSTPRFAQPPRRKTPAKVTSRTGSSARTTAWAPSRDDAFSPSSSS